MSTLKTEFNSSFDGIRAWVHIYCYVKEVYIAPRKQDYVSGILYQYLKLSSQISNKELLYNVLWSPSTLLWIKNKVRMTDGQFRVCKSQVKKAGVFKRNRYVPDDLIPIVDGNKLKAEIEIRVKDET